MIKHKFFFILTLVVVALGILAIQLPSHPHLPTTTTQDTLTQSPGLTADIKNPHTLKLLSEYENIIQEYLLRSHTPGAAVAIVKDTSILYLRGFGVKQLGTSDSIDIETVFRLGSVSKCFAPVLTGVLLEDSLLTWDDKVVQYLPNFALKSKEQTGQLTLKHVLSHTTGLPYHTYTNLIEDHETLPNMLHKLRDINMIGKVGSVYSYQNVAYSVIGEVIKSASKDSYENQMTKRIFEPLNMSHASITYAQMTANSNIAKPHWFTRKGLTVAKISDTYYNVSPAGGVNASITDMAHWISALLGNKKDFISTKTLDDIFNPIVKAPVKNRNFYKWERPTGSYYAMGWRVLNFKNDTLYYHGGYVNGYRSELAISRKNHIGICILTNAPGELADNSIPSFYNLYMHRRDSIQLWDNQYSSAQATLTK